MANPEKELNEDQQEAPITQADLRHHTRGATLAYVIQGITVAIVFTIGLIQIRDNRDLIHRNNQIRNQQIAIRNFNTRFVCKQINKRVIVPDRQNLERGIKQTDLLLKSLGFTESQITTFKNRQRPLIREERKRLAPLPCKNLPIVPKRLKTTTTITH